MANLFREVRSSLKWRFRGENVTFLLHDRNIWFGNARMYNYYLPCLWARKWSPVIGNIVWNKTLCYHWLFMYQGLVHIFGWVQKSTKKAYKNKLYPISNKLGWNYIQFVRNTYFLKNFFCFIFLSNNGKKKYDPF